MHSPKHQARQHRVKPYGAHVRHTQLHSSSLANRLVDSYGQEDAKQVCRSSATGVGLAKVATSESLCARHDELVVEKLQARQKNGIVVVHLHVVRLGYVGYRFLYVQNPLIFASNKQIFY